MRWRLYGVRLEGANPNDAFMLQIETINLIYEFAPLYEYKFLSTNRKIRKARYKTIIF